MIGLFNFMIIIIKNDKFILNNIYNLMIFTLSSVSCLYLDFFCPLEWGIDHKAKCDLDGGIMNFGWVGWLCGWRSYIIGSVKRKQSSERKEKRREGGGKI